MTRRVKLIAGEMWFPQNVRHAGRKLSIPARVPPREIVRSLSNLVQYRIDREIRQCSPSAMRAWIKKWACKL